MRHVALLVLVAVDALPLAALADCVTVHCLCSRQPGVEVVEALASTAPPATATGRIRSLHGETGTDQVGDVVSFVPFVTNIDAGHLYLLAVAGQPQGSRSALAPIDADGAVVCEKSVPVITLPLSEAVAAALSKQCLQDVVARGYSEPCNDTGCLCSSSGPAALALAGLRRRRR